MEEAFLPKFGPIQSGKQFCNDVGIILDPALTLLGIFLACFFDVFVDSVLNDFGKIVARLSMAF